MKAVVAAPAEIDITTAEQLRAVLLAAARRGDMTVVTDMTRTRSCDPAGLSVLVRAHRRALTEGGQLRVVIPAGSPVLRVFTLTGLHRLIPWFTGPDQAIAVPAPAPASAIWPRPAGPHLARQPASPDQEG